MLRHVMGQDQKRYKLRTAFLSHPVFSVGLDIANLHSQILFTSHIAGKSFSLLHSLNWPSAAPPPNG
jgi:hypothetical protein